MEWPYESLYPKNTFEPGSFSQNQSKLQDLLPGSGKLTAWDLRLNRANVCFLAEQSAKNFKLHRISILKLIYESCIK